VYVAPFPGPGGRWLISSAGGTDQRWRADGKEILYRGADALWSAAVTLEHDRVDVGEVKRLYNFRKLGSRLTFDVSPDGQRILAITERAEAAAEPLTLVVNWPALLKK
jgi:hypothetical protein